MPPPDVLLVLCDTARADAFRPWGGPRPTPTVERLGREGVRYANAWSQAPWTLPSTASMFTGKLPTEHGITGECFRWVDRKPTSPAEAVRAYPGPWVPEVLRERGYRTWGASCNSWVSTWGGFDRGFDRFEDLRPWSRMIGPWQGLARRARRALGKLDRGGRYGADRFAARLAAAGSEPLFAFVNLMETHAPLDPPGRYYPFAPWKRFRTRWLAGGADQGLSFNAGMAEPPPDYVAMLRALYYGSAQYEDQVLGRFLQAVEERGRPTVMIVLADHGEQLGEHGLFNHNSSLYEPLLHVPLVAWSQGVDLSAGPVDGPVSLLGLAGWLAGLAEGRVEPMPADGPVVAEYEGTASHNGIPDEIRVGIERRGPGAIPPLILNPGLAVRQGSMKYLVAGDGREWLFDLSADPGEEHDLAATNPDAMAGFRPLRDAWAARRSSRPQYEAGEVAEGDIAEHLRELGYIE